MSVSADKQISQYHHELASNTAQPIHGLTSIWAYRCEPEGLIYQVWLCAAAFKLHRIFYTLRCIFRSDWKFPILAQHLQPHSRCLSGSKCPHHEVSLEISRDFAVWWWVGKLLIITDGIFLRKFWRPPSGVNLRDLDATFCVGNAIIFWVILDFLNRMC